MLEAIEAPTGDRGRHAIAFSQYAAVPPQVQKQWVQAFRPRVEED